MSVPFPSFVFPLLALFLLAVFVFAVVLLSKGAHDRRRRALSHGCTLLLAVVPWLALVGSLGSLTTLGALACRVGLYSTLPAPLPAASSVLITAQPLKDRVQPFQWVALHASTGSPGWTKFIDDGGSTVSDGTIYVVSHNNIVSAYRTSNGSLLWRSSPGSSQQQGIPNGPVSVMYGTPPVVADGIVYVRVSVQSSVATEQIDALQASTGRLAWSVPIASGDPSYRQPSFAAGSGLLVVPARQGGIAAYSARDGSLAWNLTGKPFSQRVSSFDFPALFFQDQTLYFVKGDTSQGSVTQSTVVALHPATGQVLWQQEVEGALDPSIQGPAVSSPSSDFHTHLYVNAFGTLYALDTSTGALLWQHVVDGSSGTPVEAHGVVYVPAGYFLQALRASDGSQLWRQSANALSWFGTPVILQNVILVASWQMVPDYSLFHLCPGSSVPPDAIFALNASDGSIYWRYPISAGTFKLSATS